MSVSEIVKIREIEGKGRAVVTSESIKAGQILLRESPILLYSAIPLRNGVFSKYCSNCFRTLNPIPTAVTIANHTSISCPSCSYHALFCSPNCRSIALSSSHSPWVCQALNSIRYTLSLDSESRVQLYFLIAAYNLALVSPSQFQLLLSLQGEGEGEGEGQVHQQKTLALHSFISPLCSSQVFTGFSPRFTAALLAKDKQNAFGLMEPFQQDNGGETNVRAYAIYHKASFFNHDCLPNACRFDYVDHTDHGNNTDIIVRAIHDIPPGREICLSYFPVNWNYADRQKRLLEDYGFTCECDRCKVESNWTEDDDDDDNNMEEGEDEHMAASEDENGVQGNNDNEDFPHAYFFLRYQCDQNSCVGTLAPLPPSEATPSNVMECNVCGNLRTEEEINGDEGEDDVTLDG